MSVAARLPLLFLGMLSLVIGILAGLARLAITMPPIATAQMGGHGALMISAFLGTVISLERAVALARRWPYLAPLCAGLGGLAMICGLNPMATQAFSIAGGLVLLAGSLLILRQQPAMYTTTLALGALSWLIGSLTWSIGLQVFAFGLLALAFWLLRYDIARHTLRQSGLARFIAACLLSGYIWLAFGALLGLSGGFSPGHALRDAALHSIFLGFVFSMIFGHAPIIFPAVAKIRIPYHPAFYLPLAALHASLLMRVVGDLTNAASLRQFAGIANAITLLLFIITLLSSAVRGTRKKTA